MAVGGTLGSIGETEVSVDGAADAVTSQRKSLTTLAQTQAAKPVAIAVRGDEDLLLAQDLARFSIPADQLKGLRLAKPGIGPKRPFRRVDGLFQCDECAAPVASRHEHAAFLERQLTLD